MEYILPISSMDHMIQIMWMDLYQYVVFLLTFNSSMVSITFHAN